MTFWRRSGPLAAAAGLALGMTAPPLSAWALGFACPALLLAAIEAHPEGPRAGQGFAAGAVAGTVVNAVALYWIVGLLQTFARFPWVAAVPTAIVFWVLQGLPFALAGGATAALARRGVPSWLVLPAAWTVAFTITPSLFPWRPSASQVPFVPWIQLAELGGAPLLDFLLALGGCALVRAVRPPGPRIRRIGALAVAAVALAGPAVYGTLRLPEVRAARERVPVVRVGVVQPNVGIFEKHDRFLWEDQLERLQEMTRDLEARGADLVVWPETSYPYPFPRGRMRDIPGRRSVRGGHVRGPLLFGALTRRGICDRWNSVLAMEPSGRVVGVADKVRLLHFGETVPLWHVLPPLRMFFRCPGLRAGDHPPLVHLAGVRMGVLNCYEDILARHVRWLAGFEPELLVNATNDAWFGDTTEPHLHHQVARLRAVETRRDLVRAVNTGVSGHVTATGENAVRTETWVRTSFVAEARRLGGTTPWVRFGDLTSALLLGALLGVILGVRRRPLQQR